MATVRRIQLTNKDMTNEERRGVLQRNFKTFVATPRVNLDELERRINICSVCSNCFRGSACRALGNCSSSRHDFFTMHLNRNNGGCPTGQW